MTLTLELPAEMEARLQVLAATRGTAPSSLALQLVAEGLRDVPTPEPWPEMASLLSFAAALPNHRAAAGLPGLGDTSRSAESDLYGYSEREDDQR